MRLLTKTLLVIAILLGSGGISAAAVITGSQPEQLVEGHTVFTVIEQIEEPCPEYPEECPVEYAAAVAVYVREIQLKPDTITTRFPGVLWFNDQYLVNPRGGSQTANAAQERAICNGAIIATSAGAPTPPPLNDPTAYNDLTYNESYQIRPPQLGTRNWVIDKWEINGSFVWTVALMSDDSKYSTPDDGNAGLGCVESDTSLCRLRVIGLEGTCSPFEPPAPLPATNRQVGDNGRSYNSVRYNGLLYFKLADLAPSLVVKNHTKGSTDYQNDVSACHPSQGSTYSLSSYPCPSNDDTREGNSHAHNGDSGWPWMRGVDAKHGGSADCTGDTVNDEDCHATYDITVYYGVAAAPTQRNFTVIDTVGHEAPYHCHPDDHTGALSTDWCNKAESPFADYPQVPR